MHSAVHHLLAKPIQADNVLCHGIFSVDAFDITAANVGDLQSITLHLTGNDGWNVEWVRHINAIKPSTSVTFQSTMIKPYLIQPDLPMLT